MTWNYRIVKCRDASGEPYFGLFEVFYDTDGRPRNRTEDPATFACAEDEGPNGIRLSLHMAIKDATERPVLNDEEYFSEEITP